MDTLDPTDAPPQAPPRAAGLDALFSPRSVAVVGASRRARTIGGEIFGNLLRCGFTGVAYPVNPSAEAVGAVKAYPSVSAIPDQVDLAVVVVPAPHVQAIAEDCAAAGVKAMVVISAGFRDAGPEGAARERALLELVRAHGMRLVGPNCLGVINADPAVQLDATFAPTWPMHGRAGFLTQSGALGVAILDYGHDLGLGVSTFVSIGNRADVSANDLLEFWEHDPKTDVILLYLESFGNPHKFTRIARRVARRKPIVAVKSGRSIAGSRAASSHTGALAGVDVAADALFWQNGVIRVDTLEELFNTALMLSTQPIPRGPRVAIVTNAGGPGILAADACEANGLELPELSDATQAALAAFLPPEASTRNPVDMIASAGPDAYGRALDVILNDDAIDSVITIFVPPIVTRAEEVAEAIKRAAQANPAKPLLCNFLGNHGVPASLRSLQEGSIPSFAFPEAAAIALARATHYGQWLARPEGRIPTLADTHPDRARALMDDALSPLAPGDEAWLTPDQTEALLAAYGVATPPQQAARTADEAVAAADAIGYPVALKLDSATIAHKTEVQGVRLGLNSADEVWDAFAGIRHRLEGLGRADEMRGVLVQAMVREGVEVIVGATQDPAFGTLMMCGLGGIHVELLRDVSVRVHPLRDIDADEMIRALRSSALLEGYRGAPPADVPALKALLLRMSALLSDLPSIVELDLNPIKLREPGSGALVVDARVRIQRAD